MTMEERWKKKGLRSKCQIAFVECLRTTVPETDGEITARM